MNAATESRNLPATPHPTHKFKLLLKRELWEHRGGFFWAPVIVGAIAIVFALIAAVAGTVLGPGLNDVRIDGHEIDEVARITGAIGDGTLLGGIGLAMIVLTFVVFFYALGSLYDDRRDRSILFWKSLPISDSQMVLSKVAWALLLAPLLAVVIGIATGLALWVITALTTSINGLPGSAGIFLNSHPFRVIGNVLAMWPVQMAWALPTIGWLMLCSAWARSKPFLWAVIVPVLTCALVSFMDIFPGVSIRHDVLWYVVAYRGLMSLIPGSFAPILDVSARGIDGPGDVANVIDATASWQAFATIDMWIGVAIGAAMIYAAIRLRRWREEG
ncbi:ABC transporter permease [Marilutibacter alkalisoli]|uniref:ABC transporter permease n=1 Tax=Marilutibacter alkalisoli TaxID=2591633 RepID=A0A514BRD1_9GAMM|nr:ABC transporter permease [Lysobacter alkalisoli]QDH69940.1 ABC transporter permease [Lysobacter alkalisoli]